MSRPERRPIEVDGPMLAAIVCTGVTVFAAVMTVLGLIADGLVTSLATLGQMAVWAFGAGAVLYVWRWWATRTERRVGRLGGMRAPVHAHGNTGSASGTQRFIGRHEVGHVRGAIRKGMGVDSVVIGQGYGYVQAQRFVSVPASITFLAAGHLAVGSKSGADFDLAQIRRLARMLPAETRKQELHDAIAEARRIVACDAAIIRREGHRLADTGKW